MGISLEIGKSSTGKRHLVAPSGASRYGEDAALCGAGVHGRRADKYEAAEIWYNHDEYGRLVEAEDPEGIGRLCKTCWRVARDDHHGDLMGIYELADEASRNLR